MKINLFSNSIFFKLKEANEIILHNNKNFETFQSTVKYQSSKSKNETKPKHFAVRLAENAVIFEWLKRFRPKQKPSAHSSQTNKHEIVVFKFPDRKKKKK